MTRRAPARLLVYHPDEAKEYAALIRAPRAHVAVTVCATPGEAADAVGETDIIYAWKFPPELYPSARRLRWVQGMGAGVEWVLVPGLPAGVTVTRAPGVFGPWMREYVLGWCLWTTQRMDIYRTAQQQRRWRQETLPERLGGKTMVIVGLGDIGRAIGAGARALGMRVIGVSRSGRSAREVDRVYRLRQLARALGEGDFVVLVLPLTEATRDLIGATALAAADGLAWLGGPDRLNELLAGSDVVLVCTPLTEATRGLIGAAELARMRPDAALINVARGPVVDEAALYAALRDGRIAGAAIDVWWDYPPTNQGYASRFPFQELENVIMTPHVSGWTEGMLDARARVIAENVGRAARGEPPVNLIP